MDSGNQQQEIMLMPASGRCPRGGHVCVRPHLQWITLVWECLGVYPDPASLSPRIILTLLNN